MPIVGDRRGVRHAPLVVFRRFFQVIIEQCQQAGLVWGKELYSDATQVQADAAMDSFTARFAVEARQAHQAHQARREEREACEAQQGQQADQDNHTQQTVEAHLSALFPTADPQSPRISKIPRLQSTDRGRRSRMGWERYPSDARGRQGT